MTDEKKPFAKKSFDKKPFEKKPFRGEKNAASGEKKPFRGKDGDKKPYGKPFGGSKVGGDGKKSGFRGDKPSFGGEKPARMGDKKPFRGEKKNFGDHRRPYGGDRERRPVEKKPEQQEGLASRRLALEVIREVTEKDAYASLALNEKLNNCGLSLQDRRLVTRLVYDTIEHLLYLDHALNQVMAKPDTDLKLRNILRLGACQLLLENGIPESAATNTSVVLCKELGMEGLAGVCNGILRNLIRQKDALQWPDPETEPVKAASLRHSVPEWLVEKITADYGEEAELLMAHREPDDSVTVRPNLTRLDDAAFEALLDKKVWTKEPGRVPHSWRIRGMADIGRDADFVGGKFSIQSESSMMAVMALEPKPGMQILDACAAPGGKSCLMAELMNGSGRVQAWELHPHRMELITAQARRLGLENVRPMTRDAAKPREELHQTMDAVLLDAPCSGLGVMAEKPDVRYRVTGESVAELAETQQKLLDAVAPYVKKGGTLVYSTCSILKDENVRQVEAFLARHPEFELQKLPECIPETFRAHEDVGLQLLPHRDHVEGFYICRMRRKRV